MIDTRHNECLYIQKLCILVRFGFRSRRTVPQWDVSKAAQHLPTRDRQPKHTQKCLHSVRNKQRINLHFLVGWGSQSMNDSPINCVHSA